MIATPRATDRTEFRSPAPPYELTFADGGADEIRAFASLLRRAGASATRGAAAGTGEQDDEVREEGVFLLREPSIAEEAEAWVGWFEGVKRSAANGIYDSWVCACVLGKAGDAVVTELSKRCRVVDTAAAGTATEHRQPPPCSWYRRHRRMEDELKQMASHGRAPG